MRKGKKKKVDNNQYVVPLVQDALKVESAKICADVLESVGVITEEERSHLMPEETCIPLSEPATEERFAFAELPDESMADLPVFEPAESSSALTCDCSKKVALIGDVGKDYFVLHVMSKSLDKKWHLHNRKDCYKEVSKKIEVAHKVE